MKKIINGVRFDTEKAEEIGSCEYGCPSDFGHWEATLYITPRSKKFFIAGSGGPMSRFSRSVGQNTWSGGSDLTPLTKEEALEFAEEHLEIAEIEKYFEIEEA